MAQYRMLGFLESDDIIIDPGLQNRPRSPVSMALVKRFLDNFEAATFEFDGPVGSIIIDDGDMDQLWLSGGLCAQTVEEGIEEVERSGKDPVPVARISFKAVGADWDWTYSVRVEPLQHPAPSLSAADHYKRAMSSSGLDVTIRELDACLCANPKPFLAMAAYFNVST